MGNATVKNVHVFANTFCKNIGHPILNYAIPFGMVIGHLRALKKMLLLFCNKSQSNQWPIL